MTRIAPMEDPMDAAPLLRQLRTQLDDATFAHRLSRAVAQGYRVIGAFDAADVLIGALGYRITDDLCWGRTLFIDDLVVAPATRGQGIGAQLLAHARALAQTDCDHMRLCSGLSRTQAHRFYEANGLARFSLQFVTDLREI
ncbi:MAG: GNAT family N-acetyltransferase [Pseudomonadota bacterium]